MNMLVLLVPLMLSSCASVNNSNRHGFFPNPGMHEDAQDRTNTKYNLMDSTDGKQDPNAQIRMWGATY